MLKTSKPVDTFLWTPGSPCRLALLHLHLFAIPDRDPAITVVTTSTTEAEEEEEKSGVEGEAEAEAEVEVEVGVTQVGARINITVGQEGDEKTIVQMSERSMVKRAEEEVMIDIANNDMEDTVMT